MLGTLRHVYNAYRARRYGKHPEHLYDMIEKMENHENEVIQEFGENMRDRVGENIESIEFEKDGVDFSNEATVMFYLVVFWERHDIFTGADIDSADDGDDE